ncbi:MAG: hypothetical protein ACREKR_00995 [Candidatus Methylomirabilales bacterium]
MAGAKKKARNRQTTAGRAAKSRRALWLGGALAVIVVIGLVVLASRSPQPPAGPTGQPTGPVAALAPDQAGPDRLIGRWLRPDGGYVIAIRSAQTNGILDAAYFNPRPINVSRAEWRHDGGRLQVFIELRDANYPGSTYDLAYLPEQDRLVGDYFQAAHRETFHVEFTRMPK